MTITASRQVAYTVLRRVFEDGAYADRALHAEAKALGPRDRSLAMRLAYGTVQRRRTLDHVLGQLLSRPLAKLQPSVLASLRLGLYQVLFLGGVADYAAVNESVELAKQTSRGGAQLVNAVLRRAGREGGALLDALDDSTPAGAAVRHSVPDWLAEMWWRELGAEPARALLEAVNQPAESAIRANTLKLTREQLLLELPAAAQAHTPPPWTDQPGLPEPGDALVLDGAFDAFGSAPFVQGHLMPQSRASATVAHVLAPQPGERVLDMCAAPGGKTTHIAALMAGEGEVVASEVHPQRARALRQTCGQLGASIVTVTEADAREFSDPAGFDRVLLDPPCSGLGTLQSRPDLRWQPRREQITELAAKQAQMLRRAGLLLRSGGVIVYSVCTISAAEGQGVTDAFLAEHADFQRDGSWQLLPSRDRTDGFYIARLRRG